VILKNVYKGDIKPTLQASHSIKTTILSSPERCRFQEGQLRQQYIQIWVFISTWAGISMHVGLFLKAIGNHFWKQAGYK
jgi:hypothetical protein